MLNPPNHPSLSGHSANGTTLAPNEETTDNSQGIVNATTFTLQSQDCPVLSQLDSHQHVDAARTTRSNFGTHQSNEDTAANIQGTVNATLSVNSTSTFSFQSQTYMLGQLASHHHVDAARTRRSNFGPHQWMENTTNNNQGTVNATLSRNSALFSQSHAFPVSGQLATHHHLEATRTRRSNINIVLHRQSSSDPFPIRPQNAVNLNFVVGHNSSFNINLSSNPPSQLARNIMFAASSSTPPNINNAYNPTSYFQPPFFNPYLNGGSIPSRISEINGNPQFTRSHSPYASPIAASVRGETPRSNVSDPEQEIPPFPCLRQSTVNLSPNAPHKGQPPNPCPRIPSQNHTISQSGMGSLFNHPSGLHSNNQPTRYYFSGSSSTLNSPNHQVLVPGGGNGMFPVTEELTEQAPEPIFSNIPHPQTELLQELSQLPSQNDNTARTEHFQMFKLLPGSNYRSSNTIRISQPTIQQCDTER